MAGPGPGGEPEPTTRGPRSDATTDGLSFNVVTHRLGLAAGYDKPARTY